MTVRDSPCVGRRAWGIACAALVFLAGCAEQRPVGTVISNVLLYDGTGGAPRVTSVRLVGERVDTIGNLRPEPDEWYIDGNGLALRPGFIEVGDEPDAADGERSLAALSRGVTTIVVGVGGRSPWPVSTFLAARDSTRGAVNVASFVGLGTLRRQAGIPDTRGADAGERDSLRTLLFAELDGGALGLAAAIDSLTASELVDLARTAIAEGARIMLTVENGVPRLWRDLGLALRVSREAGVPIYVVPHAGPGWPDGVDRLLDSARGAGVQVLAPLASRAVPEEWIRLRTSLPALALGLRERGSLRSGAWADLVLTDSATVGDSAGVRIVWVNGDIVWERGRALGPPTGKAVRRR